MKKIIIIFLAFQFLSSYSQQTENLGLKIINLSTKQINLMNKYKSEPIEIRNKILLDSIYIPNLYLWNGYLGDENDFITWMNNVAFLELPKYNEKANNINLDELNDYFFETVNSMEKFTNHKPFGKWYIFFGPKWANLGGFEDGTMLIDLAHSSNKNLNNITLYFPHEINHQIYSNTIKPNKDAVLYRILDEGFACYVSYIYHNGKTTISEELNYKESEYQFCRKNDKELIELLKRNYKSNSDKLSDNFVSRGYKFSEKYPTAIGYYLGFRIVEEYVKKYGKESWKDIYKLSPKKVLRKSKILKL